MNGDLEIILVHAGHLRLDEEGVLILPHGERHMAPRRALPIEGLGLIAEHPVEQGVKPAKRADREC